MSADEPPLATVLKKAADCRECLQILKQFDRLRADWAASLPAANQRQWRELLEEGRVIVGRAFGVTVCEHLAVASECESCRETAP